MQVESVVSSYSSEYYWQRLFDNKYEDANKYYHEPEYEEDEEDYWCMSSDVDNDDDDDADEVDLGDKDADEDKDLGDENTDEVVVTTRKTRSRLGGLLVFIGLFRGFG